MASDSDASDTGEPDAPSSPTPNMPPPRLPSRRRLRRRGMSDINYAQQQDPNQDSGTSDESVDSEPDWVVRPLGVQAMRGLSRAAIIDTSPSQRTLSSAPAVPLSQPMTPQAQRLRSASILSTRSTPLSGAQLHEISHPPQDDDTFRIHNVQGTHDSWGGPGDIAVDAADDRTEEDYQQLFTKWENRERIGDHGNCDIDQRRYRELYNTDIYAFMKDVLKPERRFSVLKHISEDYIMWIFYLILSSFHLPLLEGLLFGDLCVKLAAHDEAVTKAKKDVADWAAGKGERQPAIYGQFLVNKQGYSLTIRDFRQVLNAMSDGLHPDSQYHHILRKSIVDKDPSKIKKAAPTKIRIFIAASRKRLDSGQYHDDDHLLMPHANIGYSIEANKRLRTHRSRPAQSNYVMHYMGQICQQLFGDKYHIEQIILYHIPYWMCAESSEILLTRLTQGYTAHGGGFAYEYAGISVDSVKKVTPQLWQEYYIHAWTAGIISDYFDRLLDAKKEQLRDGERVKSAEMELLKIQIKQKEADLRRREQALDLESFTRDVKAKLQVTPHERNLLRQQIRLADDLADIRQRYEAPPDDWVPPDDVGPLDMSYKDWPIDHAAWPKTGGKPHGAKYYIEQVAKDNPIFRDIIDQGYERAQKEYQAIHDFYDQL